MCFCRLVQKSRVVAIFRKELNVFSSLIGYIAITIFLVANGLFNWVFTDTSIMESGYANLEPFSTSLPGSFLFLVPAITMRSFAEEKNSGTLELLATRPVTDLQIIGGKFLATHSSWYCSACCPASSIISPSASSPVRRAMWTPEVSSVRISTHLIRRMLLGHQPLLHRP